MLGFSKVAISGAFTAAFRMELCTGLLSTTVVTLIPLPDFSPNQKVGDHIHHTHFSPLINKRKEWVDHSIVRSHALHMWCGYFFSCKRKERQTFCFAEMGWKGKSFLFFFTGWEGASMAAAYRDQMDRPAFSCSIGTYSDSLMLLDH